MGHWNSFFLLLQQEAPTVEERNSAHQVAQTAVDAHYALLKNKTPKVHVAEDHAVEQYLRLRPGFMRLLIEHWVEQNHQTSSKIENMYKRVPSLPNRADFAAKERHARNNAEVKKKISRVHGNSSQVKKD